MRTRSLGSALLSLAALALVTGAWWLLAAGSAAPADGLDAHVVDAGRTPFRARAELPAPAPPRAAPAPGAESRTPTPLRSVAGTIVRRCDGLPLRGVVVEVLGPDAEPGDAALLLPVTTRADGAFAIDGLPQGCGLALRCTWQPQREILDEGRAWDERLPRPPVSLVHPLSAGELPRDLSLELDTGWMLRGLVLDAQDRPLEGAFLAAGADGPRAWTDAVGEFLLKDLARGALPAEISAWAPGRVDQVQSVEMPPADAWEATALFRLAHAGVIHGEVLTDTGRVVAGAEIVVPIPGFDSGVATQELRLGVTDSTGRFEIADVPEGRFTVVCRWRLSPDETLLAPRTASGRDVRVDPEHPARVNFRLGAGASLSGQVFSGGPRPLAAGHLLDIWTLPSAEWSTAPIVLEASVLLSDAGVFTATGLDPGPKLLEVFSPTWGASIPGLGKATSRLGLHRHRGVAAAEQDSRVLLGQRRVEVPAAGLSDADITIERSASLRGRIVDDTGRALAGRELAVVSVQSEAWNVGSTDRDGKFEVGRVHSIDVPLVFIAEPEQPACVTIPLLVLPSGGDLGTLTLAPRPGIEVQIVDAESGEALPHAVALWHLRGGGQGDTVFPLAASGDSPRRMAADRSSGAWALIVTAHGYRAWRRSDVLKAGPEPESIVVRLQPE